VATACDQPPSAKKDSQCLKLDSLPFSKNGTILKTLRFARKKRKIDAHMCCDVKDFLATIGEGRTLLPVPKGQTIYAQGAASMRSFISGQGK
jgi:hypothetical protein